VTRPRQAPAAPPTTQPGPPREGRLAVRSDPGRGVYGISVAAELVGMGAQTLRLYETRGLLEPERTPGGTRRYSPNDLDRARRIGHLLTDGLNLAGIAMVLDLEEQNTHLRTTNQDHPMNTDPNPTGVDPDLVEYLVPEADRLEQATPVDPAGEDQSPLPERRTDWADDADQLDQHSTWADTDEDDYPHQPGNDDRM